MLRDSVYQREWIGLNYENNTREYYEVYITKERDTFVNQYKYYVNGVLDTLHSEYYELEILDTDKEHFYKGKIKLNHKYTNLKDENRILNFAFLSQNKDSVFTNYLEFNEPEFEFIFENYRSKRLQGFIYQISSVKLDSFVNGEQQVNVNELKLAIDSDIYTDNLFFEIMGWNEKLSLDKTKLTKSE